MSTSDLTDPPTWRLVRFLRGASKRLRAFRAPRAGPTIVAPKQRNVVANAPGGELCVTTMM
jgi:hypothetical protein